MSSLPSGASAAVQQAAMQQSTEMLALQATNNALMSNATTSMQLQRQQEAAKTDAAVAMVNSSNKRVKDIQL